MSLWHICSLVVRFLSIAYIVYLHHPYFESLPTLVIISSYRGSGYDFIYCH